MNPRRQLLSALILGAMTLSLAGCNSEPSSITSPADLSPPQSPSNVHGRYDDRTGRDWLAWDPSASANVTGYEVYYASAPGSADVMLGTVPSTDTEFALPLTAGGTVEYYRLRAIGSNGVPSAFTGTVSVTRVGWDGGQPPSDSDKGTKGTE